MKTTKKSLISRIATLEKQITLLSQPKQKLVVNCDYCNGTGLNTLPAGSRYDVCYKCHGSKQRIITV